MQQIPATGSPYAKPVKKIFTAPKGYVFVGADQRALEDHISALTTKDKNKLKVYQENYDGHCLRSYSYYTEQMPDIEAKMQYADKDGKYFKVTLDDGTVKVFYESDPEYKELINA
jgi:DNA polymerase-1